jgi:hypothetical protein
MVTDYRVKIKIVLRAIKSPCVKISVDNQQQVCQIDQLTEFDYDFVTNNSTVDICVEHFNKHNTDSETAVEIVSIEFFDISDPAFAWAGTYRPDYPEPWYSQQTLKPASSLPGQTYLGWNGVYRLEVSVPVFEWMHKKLAMGWIYR